MRPYQLLPLPFPSVFDPSEKQPDYFYQNFAKKFIPDMIKMMDEGLAIDEKAVEDLRIVIDEVLLKVAILLEKNPLIIKFQKYRLPMAQKAHRESVTQSVRTIEHYLKPYNEKDMVHRTWVINSYLLSIGKPEDVKDKWSLADLKKYNVWLKSSFINDVINKKVKEPHKHITTGMEELAKYKVELWNRPRYEKAAEPVILDPFNPGSAKQCQEFFQMLEIEPLATSKKTGDASWGRDQIEELLEMTSDPDLIEVLEAMIDYSYGGIIKSNFLKAFDSYTVDGVLHGNIKLFGAKSFRNTSNSPNLLNAPSTGSIYAKPLKRCFKAPDGHVIFTADLSALEDRVMANLSGDLNKLALFLENLDGHSMSATYYFKQRVTDLIGEYIDHKQASKDFHNLVKAENKIAEAIRQDSKPVNFGLAYGAYPPKIAATIKCTLEEAERIFNVYHQELYSGITDYRENYVLQTAKTQGYIHLGLGCRMYVSNADQSIRTLVNGTVQFWSILTLIAINEFNYRIKEAGLEKDVRVSSTIYDSIYVNVIRNAETIKWVNDNLIELMCVQYLEEEQIHNETDGKIGLNWTDLFKVPNNASIEEIKEIMESIDAWEKEQKTV